MLVIILTVLTQGPSVKAEYKGKMSTPLWTINGGIFQAIGVISFGIIGLPTPSLSRPKLGFANVRTTKILAFVCRMFSPVVDTGISLTSRRPQQPPHIWFPPETYPGPFCYGNELFYWYFTDCMSCHGARWLPNLQRQDGGKCSQQFPC